MIGLSNFIRLSDYKLFDCIIPSQLVENTWSFKPIRFEESVIFAINWLNEDRLFQEQAVNDALLTVLMAKRHATDVDFAS